MCVMLIKKSIEQKISDSHTSDFGLRGLASFSLSASLPVRRKGKALSAVKLACRQEGEKTRN